MPTVFSGACVASSNLRDSPVHVDFQSALIVYKLQMINIGCCLNCNKCQEASGVLGH